MKQIYWYELPGNRYLKKLEPAMLSSDGCVIEQEFRVTGKKQRERFRVKYDREYVINKLSIEVLQPLGIKTPDQLGALMTDLLQDLKICKAS